MSIGLTPYLQFPGTAREALEFYAEVFDGELEAHTYGEIMGLQDENKDLLMHGSLYMERGAHIMAADLWPGSTGNGLGTMSLSSSESDPEENARILSWWAPLSEGAEIQIPLGPAPWSEQDQFGQLKDRFGVEWMFVIGGDSGD